MANTTDLLNSLPGADAGFLADLLNYLEAEDQERFKEHFRSFIFTGGIHATAAGLAGSPTADLVAYIDGVRVQEPLASTITYPDNETIWVIAHHTPAGGPYAAFTQVGSTNYMIDSASSSQPALPSGGVFLMKVTTSGGAITAVQDLRTTSPIVRTVEVINVKDHGAIGDNVADDTSAIQSAIDAAVATGPLNVYFPKGSYRTTASVGPKTEAFGLHLFGDGLQSSSIVVDHLLGPGVTFNRSNSGMSDITVNASATRTAGAVSTNHGIYMEPADTAGKSIASMHFDRVRVINQPASGFVQVGANQLSRFNHCLAQDNGEHGYVYDSGTISSRTNTSFTGLVTMDTCWALNNTGHGMVVGNPSDTVLEGNARFLMLNCEFDQNAQNAGTRFKDSDAWIRAENVSFVNCAFGTTVGAIYFLGRNLNITNQRSVTLIRTLELDTDTLTTSTYGINIDGLRVLNTAQNPVIKVTDLVNVHSITVRTYGTVSNMTKMFTAGAVRASWDMASPAIQVARKTANQSVTSSTTLVDATDLAIALRSSETVYFEATLRYAGNATGDFKVGITAPTGANVRWQNAGSTYIAAGDTVAVSNSDLTESTSRILGAATGARIASIVGRVTMSTTAGDLKVQFAQGTSDLTAVQMLEGSVLKVFRENANI